MQDFKDPPMKSQQMEREEMLFLFPCLFHTKLSKQTTGIGSFLYISSNCRNQLS